MLFGAVCLSVCPLSGPCPSDSALISSLRREIRCLFATQAEHEYKTPFD